jgi:hypothetical protein
MSARILAALALASISLAVAGCTRSGAPDAGSAAPAAALMPAAQPGQLVVQGYAAPVPAAWVAGQPSSSMRVAQFALPAAAGLEPGELAVYFFPPGQGGSHEANIARWASQFAGADGKPGTPKVDISKAGETEVTLVELHGSYARGVGMGPSGDAKPDQALVIAMLETPNGRITLQMYGPAKTVEGQRAAFLQLARGLRHPG